MPMPAPMLPPQLPPLAKPIPPYLASKTAARAGRPLEPWKDSLRLMMFVWGGVLLLAFLTPTSTDPLRFMFHEIIDGEGTSKLYPLIIAAVGLLSIVLAAIPMSPSPRGLIAGLMGMSGIVTPILLALSKGDFNLQQALVLVGLVGTLLLIPGLLLRSEYRDSIMPRILVTLGAIAVLLPELIPQHDTLPLVAQFKQIIDAEGTGKIRAIIGLGPTVLAVCSLLVWLPAPSSAGAKVFAWLFILWPAVMQLSGLLLAGDIGAAVKGSPYAALMMWAPLSACYVLIGYGFATIFGKQLE